jgi:hypothetical protein
MAMVARRSARVADAPVGAGSAASGRVPVRARAA